jgi:5'-3' exonuclease
MGIPFYYATLLKNHSGICSPVKEKEHVEFFGIDFNCLIHRYLKDDDPVHSVIKALQNILDNICNADIVFIALDGLVPYGKIVQQRYRRFKIKEEGQFDRNQISPDTPYMRQLEAQLRIKFPNAIISPTQESGEGEHKIFKEMRKSPRTNVCVYGLDADLILLSMFNCCPQFTLLRESSEFNDTTTEFSRLSVPKLIECLPIPLDQYLPLCVLCFGNDFMPNIGMFSLREGGYSRAIELFLKCKPDLNTEEGRFTFLNLANTLEIETLQERIMIRRRPYEKAILGKDTTSFSKRYALHILDGVHNMEPVVEAFWKTFHWTMHYFKTNETLNWNWYYPYAEAPLVQSIVQYFESYVEESELNYKIANQLQFILPSKSLHTAKRRVINQNEYYSDSRLQWMKRHDWEAKPYISLPWAKTTSVSLH